MTKENHSISNIYRVRQPQTLSSNQKEFRQNFLQTVLEEHSTLNKSLQSSVHNIQKMIDHQNHHQMNQLQAMLTKIAHQEEMNTESILHQLNTKDVNEEVLKSLRVIEKQQAHIIESINDGEHFIEATMQQQSQLENKLSLLAAQFEKYPEVHAHLVEKIENNLDIQDVYHNTMMERFDKQEGLLTKLNVELNHIRSVIYERTSHLIDVLDENIRRVSAPIQRFFIHSENKDI